MLPLNGDVVILVSPATPHKWPIKRLSILLTYFIIWVSVRISIVCFRIWEGSGGDQIK